METVHQIEPGTALVLHLPQGALLGIRDLEGQQACELNAWDAEDPTHYLDPSTTMEIVGRVFPTEKSKFYSNRYEPLFTLVEDAVGHHDLLQPASSALGRQLFLGEDGSRKGTREWVLEALEKEGLGGRHVPHPVHLFRRTDVDQEGSFVMMTTPSEAGSGCVLACERALVVALAVSDDEISPVTGCFPTPIRVEVTGAV